MKKFFFLLLVALGIYYYIDTIQVKRTLTVNDTVFNLVRVSKTNQGYSNQYVKSQDSINNWNEMINIETYSNTKDHKEILMSTEKMVRPHSMRVVRDYRNDYSMLMYCLDSNSFIECSYIKAQRKDNQVYGFQYSKRYSLDVGRSSAINRINQEYNKNFNAIRDIKVPYIAKEMPTGEGIELPFKSINFKR